MSTFSPLDDRSIEDPIQRSYLHNEVVAKSNSHDTDLVEYDILPDEEYRADLAAFRIWGRSELRWAVRKIAGTEAEYSPLPIGTKIVVPPLAWLRDRIRHHLNDGETADTVDVE